MQQAIHCIQEAMDVVTSKEDMTHAINDIEQAELLIANIKTALRTRKV